MITISQQISNPEVSKLFIFNLKIQEMRNFSVSVSQGFKCCAGYAFCAEMHYSAEKSFFFFFPLNCVKLGTKCLITKDRQSLLKSETIVNNNNNNKC